MQLAIASAGSSDQLQNLVGREIVVPAEKLGLAKKQEALQGTVVLVSQEDSNCLWCTFPGNSKWYILFKLHLVLANIRWFATGLAPLAGCNEVIVTFCYRYCWHIDEVEPWLMQPWQKAVKHALSLPDKKSGKQARKSQPGASGRMPRATTTGSLSHHSTAADIVSPQSSVVQGAACIAHCILLLSCSLPGRLNVSKIPSGSGISCSCPVNSV